ncbi:Bbp16 family capsid cement protein [Novosphingobium soli]|uniref:Bbp16 family capsid cement protein n=1 Tax=Novosphingobium soli TaxID=574956 RepID=A0ABV6CWA2_9SPHN
MIFDKQTLLSDGQAITADAPSTNIIDLGATGTPFGSAVALVRDIGKGDCKVPLAIMVAAAFNNLTSLRLVLQVDNDPAFGSPKAVAERTYLLAELAGGMLEFPDGFVEGTNERYVRLYYDITGTAPTTGAITAGVVAARQTNF